MAAANCRQALALGLDVSGSVDAREYRLQIGGLAEALGDETVRATLLSMPQNPVRLMVFEWSGPEDQAILIPWTAIDRADTLDLVIETLSRTERRVSSPGTALGTAMILGASQLDTQADCTRRTLDISGDGKSNLGPRPRNVKNPIGAAGITINALVIGADDPASGDVRQAEIGALASYFIAEVITGPGAFVETALGFEEYAKAMRRKLLKELDVIVIGEMDWDQ